MVGVSPKARRNAIAAGILVEVEATVYVVAGSADTWHRQLRVGLLALGPHAWVSHEAAAELDELEGTPVEKVAAFTTLRGRRGVRLRNGIVHSTTRCGPHDVITVDGFRCASATRTVLDLAAAGASERRLAKAIDSAVRLRKSAIVVLGNRSAALRGSGRAGVRRLDLLLLDSGGESELERKFLGLVRENGLPRPKTQCRIAQGPGQVARGRLPLRGRASRDRGDRAARPLDPVRAGQGCPAPQRAPGHRLRRLRVHLGRRHEAPRLGHRHAERASGSASGPNPRLNRG